MTDSTLEPNGPAALQYRHVRTVTGILLIVVGIGLFVGIQLLRAHQEAALLALHIPPAAIVPPASLMQFLDKLAIPVLMPLIIIGAGVMLFSPTVFAQTMAAARSFLPWAKAGP